jgi:cellulose synthase/poly-beta-1,6-N-acetylglucosamine synthase-like glycosyltransferase
MDGTIYDRMTPRGVMARSQFGAARPYRPLHRRAARSGQKTTLAQVLLAHGAVTAAELSQARKIQRSLNRPLAEILLARGKVTEPDLLTAYAEHYNLGVSDLSAEAPNRALAGLLTASQAIRFGAVPWRRVGGTIVVATADPSQLENLRNALASDLRVVITLAPRAQVLEAQVALYGAALARRAESMTERHGSCRAWHPMRATRVLGLLALGLALVWAVSPDRFTALLFGAAILVFLGNVALKTAAFTAATRAEHSRARTPLDAGTTAVQRLPVVTIFVPLFREHEITSTLVRNLSKLDYPPERLDVILAIEAGDETTRAALSRCKLPPWMRYVAVPPGHPQTKPRALNFALNFARGSIVGIYDAEDRPEPDQISRVVRRFAELPADVACLQGRLDYYNSTHNLLARCFTIEYAAWFRVLLPGVQRLGLFVPLGGTTLFLRRDVVEKLGGWDAHNVTEDAELGLRLVRHGYRTEIVDTTTFEEANAAILPWIKQRSRWQKGYLMTWAAAMRQPVQLLRDLGAWRFLGFQVQVFCAVIGYLLAPLLWSMMIIPFGVTHPVTSVLGPTQIGVLAVVFVAGLTLSLALSWHATRAAHLRRNRPYLLLFELYHVLGTVSAVLATVEMLVKPYFWAKTAHGQFGGAAPVDQPCLSASSLSRTTNAIDR